MPLPKPVQTRIQGTDARDSRHTAAAEDAVSLWLWNRTVFCKKNAVSSIQKRHSLASQTRSARLFSSCSSQAFVVRGTSSPQVGPENELVADAEQQSDVSPYSSSIFHRFHDHRTDVKPYQGLAATGHLITTKPSTMACAHPSSNSLRNTSCRMLLAWCFSLKRFRRGA